MLNNLPPNLREFLLNRKQDDGSLLSCLFVVEKSTNIIVVEACGPTMVHDAQQKITAWSPKAPNGADMAYLQSDGDNMVLVLDVLTTSTPCAFPECEEWRALLKTELDKLPPDCPSCDKNAVRRRVARNLQPAAMALFAAHPEYRLQKPTAP